MNDILSINEVRSKNSGELVGLELVTRAAKERERQSDKIRAHIGRCTMSVYGTQAECKAARDALERLLDDEA